jgi:hypothetical protein
MCDAFVVRVAGALVLVFGLLLAAGLSLAPTHVTVLGTTGSCGIPVFRAIAPNTATDPTEHELTDQCKSQSIARLIEAVILGALLCTAGVVMLIVGNRHEHAGANTTQMPGWYPDPMRRHPLRYWNGMHWTEHVSNGSAVGTDPPYTEQPPRIR